MKKFLTLLLVTGWVFSVSAQRQFTKTGHVWFYSTAPLEDITAHNNQVTSVMDTQTGDMAFKVTMTAFQFEKALMQQHFNEKYVESEKFPESTFKGKITDLSGIDFSKDSTYKAAVEGILTIHGVTQPVKADGTINVKGGKVSARSLFQIAVADYEIKIPAAVQDNIAKVVDVHVDISFEPMK